MLKFRLLDSLVRERLLRFGAGRELAGERLLKFRLLDSLASERLLHFGAGRELAGERLLKFRLLDSLAVSVCSMLELAAGQSVEGREALSHRDYHDVEHYRPKGTYWWLTWTWETARGDTSARSRAQRRFRRLSR